MNPLKIAILAAFSIVIFKFVASLFGRGNIPILNRLVTVILSVFVAYELLILSKILWEKLI